MSATTGERRGQGLMGRFMGRFMRRLVEPLLDALSDPARRERTVVAVLMVCPAFTERRKLMNGRFHSLFKFVPHQQCQQQGQINDRSKK